MDKESARASVPTIEKRFIPSTVLNLECRAEEGDEPKTLSWYAALFDTLSEPLWGFRERIGRRAFSKALERDDVRGLINHDPNLILGRTGAKTLKLSVDNAGLHANVVLPDTSYARDLVENVRNGNITGGSFMFEALKDSWANEDIDGEQTLIRTVKDVKLFDVSPVTFPAYTATEGSASIRSLAEMWRAKLTGKPAEQREMAMCAAMKAMCANCETEDCAMKAQMGMGEDMRATPTNISRYRRRLELQKLKIRR